PGPKTSRGMQYGHRKLQRSVTEMRRSRTGRSWVSCTLPVGMKDHTQTRFARNTTPGSRLTPQFPGLKPAHFGLFVKRPPSAMLATPAEAAATIAAHLRPLPSEDCPLAAAHGRVLRRGIVADRPLPPFDRVTMDGFAVRSADLAAGA